MKAQEAMWRTIYAEAEPDDELDALAIGHVILNRVHYPNWPDTVPGVCFQPLQFSCWNDNAPRRQHYLEVEPEDSAWAQHCYDLAKRIIEGTFKPDPTNKATHYYATYIKRPNWAKGKKPTLETDSGKYIHRFYNNIDTPPPRNAKEALGQEKPLRKDQTVKGAAGTGAIGGGIGVDGVMEVVDLAERGSSIMDGGGMIKIVIGVIIVGLAAWMFYSRWKDRQEGKS